jgi:hypothetical protein
MWYLRMFGLVGLWFRGSSTAFGVLLILIIVIPSISMAKIDREDMVVVTNDSNFNEVLGEFDADTERLFNVMSASKSTSKFQNLFRNIDIPSFILGIISGILSMIVFRSIYRKPKPKNRRVAARGLF